MTYEDKDPRSVEALEKIKAILWEYDLWAAFVVVSAERVHWLYHFEPSWSCLHFDPATGEARIRAKRADFVTPEQQQRVVEQTTGAIASTRDFAAKQFKDAETLYAMLEKHFDITHEYSDPQFAAAPNAGDALREIEDALWALHSYESNRDDSGRSYSEADITKMVEAVRSLRGSAAARKGQ